MKIIIHRRIICVLILLALTGLLCSCVSEVDRNEAKNAAIELIEKSYEINQIFFGSGLPATEYKGNDDDELKYSEISEDSQYQTISQIKEAALKVYSSSYCQMLFTKAFEGFAVSIGTGDDAEQQIVEYARYVDYAGVLTVKVLDEDEIITLNRTYDTESIDVVGYGDNYVMISVSSFVDGVPDCDVELKLIKESGEWRLATPTY